MLIKLAALTMLPVALVGGVVANSSVLIVEVTNPDVHVVIPVPLSLVQVAMAFAPDEAKYVQIEEIGEFLPYVGRFIEELRAIPDDVMLVEVIDRRDHVRVYKEADVLRIQVEEGRGARVNVRVPLASLAAMVDAYDAETGTLRTSRLIGALRAAPSGDLVHVIDGDEEVHIRMW